MQKTAIFGGIYCTGICIFNSVSCSCKDVSNIFLSKSEKIKAVHRSVRKIRHSEKMGGRYMQLWEEKAYIREEGLAEGKSIGMKAFIELCKELGLSKDEAFDKVKEKYGAEEEEAAEYIEKYWKLQDSLNHKANLTDKEGHGASE